MKPYQPERTTKQPHKVAGHQECSICNPEIKGGKKAERRRAKEKIERLVEESNGNNIQD